MAEPPVCQMQWLLHTGTEAGSVQLPPLHLFNLNFVAYLIFYKYDYFIHFNARSQGESKVCNSWSKGFFLDFAKGL